MALVDLVYRCPECGHDPMDGEGDWARCTSCGVRIERTRSGLQVGSANLKLRTHVNAAILCKKIDAHGGPMTRALQPDGGLRYSAAVMVSWRTTESTVRYRGVLRGFTESMGPPAPGTLTVDREEVAVDDGRPDSGRWPANRLVQLRFPDDSPRRWEDLIRRLISEAYERAGRGRVVEFQPRVVTR